MVTNEEDTASVKGIVHINMTILSSFTHPYVIPNLCDIIIFFLWTIKYDSLGFSVVLDSTGFHYIDKNS